MTNPSTKLTLRQALGKLIDVRNHRQKVFRPIAVSIYHSLTVIHHPSIHAGLSFWAEKRRPRIDANRHGLRVSDLIAGTQAKNYFYLADGRFIRDLTEREDSRRHNPVLINILLEPPDVFPTRHGASSTFWGSVSRFEK